MKPSLMLNAIVRNEGARIARCLASALPHVKAVCICDTGSTDNTRYEIERMCNEAGVPFIIDEAPFENFSQARNAAFKFARRANDTWLPHCQFALLMDADMELVVDNPNWFFDETIATAASYDMMQKGGAVSYANRRLLNLNVNKPPYVGVTHEYIDVPSNGMIKGARFLDHADGSNRANKFERDAQLLEAALEAEPENARYWYYLGQTYNDWGKYAQAARAYARRVHLGGWDEEVYTAMVGLAFAMKSQGNEYEFVARMIDAYNYRPRRAEPLYWLAKHYREAGNNGASLLFSKAGVNIKRPNDLLFVNDYVYDHGLRYEYSIAGFYQEEERAGAFAATNALALDPTCPADERWSSRQNLYHYTHPLNALCPSFRPTRVAFSPPAGYTAMNPSVEVCHDVIRVNVRCVNYKIDEHGRYMIGPKECNDAPIDTRNFVCYMTETFHITKTHEIIWAKPPSAWDMVTGLEDVRLHRANGYLLFTAAVRELSPTGHCQQVTGELVVDHDDKHLLVDGWKTISNDGEYQKNWMPIEGKPTYFYRLDKVVDHLDNIQKLPTKLHVGDISGSSQAIQFKCGYLAVVHEAITGPDGKRTYWHRFAWWNKDYELRRLSKPFVFFDRQIEFCAGLAVHPDQRKLIVSFGVRDAEAWLATVSAEEVAILLGDFYAN